MGCVYLITSPSGKQYVGQTTQTAEARWYSHVYEATRGKSGCRALARAIRKYGPDAMCIEVLHETDDLDELNRLEAHEIAQRGTLTPGGYNLRTGGDNWTVSANTRELLSRNQKTAWQDPAYRAKQSAIAKARWSDPASVFNSLDFRARLSEAQKVNQSQSDVKSRKSSTMKAHWRDPSSSFNSGQRNAKLSVSKKVQCADEQYRKKLSKRMIAISRARHPNIFGDGAVYQTLGDACRAVGVTDNAIFTRIRSDNPRWRWWHTIPNHNDPIHDGFEECAAVIEWAKANPDHENVPDWARPYLDHVPPMTPGKHGKAPSWAA